MFPNLCQDPFSGPLIWKYGSPKIMQNLDVKNFRDGFKKKQN